LVTEGLYQQKWQQLQHQQHACRRASCLVVHGTPPLLMLALLLPTSLPRAQPPRGTCTRHVLGARTRSSSSSSSNSNSSSRSKEGDARDAARDGGRGGAKPPTGGCGAPRKAPCSPSLDVEGGELQSTHAVDARSRLQPACLRCELTFDVSSPL
jgi:hypothetical protein